MDEQNGIVPEAQIIHADNIEACVNDNDNHDATNAEKAVDKEKNFPTRRSRCSKCLVHGKQESYKGHKNICPFKVSWIY